MLEVQLDHPSTPSEAKSPESTDLVEASNPGQYHTISKPAHIVSSLLYHCRVCRTSIFLYFGWYASTEDPLRQVLEHRRGFRFYSSFLTY